MATLSQTISLIFQGVDQTGQAVDSVTKNIGSVTSATQSAVAPLAGFTADILKLEAATIGAGVALATYAAAVSQDFERSFREIATLIDVPLEGLSGFRNEILEYAQTSTASLDEITAATYAAISAGVAWEDALQAVDQAITIGIAGNATLGEGLEALIPTLNAYGLGMEEAGRFSDILFTAVKNGRTTIPELAAGLGQVTPIAASAGVSFEEIAAAIATLTSAGASTSQAITQIRSAIVAYLKPSSQAADLAQTLGLRFDAASLKANGLGASLAAAAQATGGSTEQLALLFGRVEGLNAALGIGGQGLDKYSSSLDDAATASGEAAAAAGLFADVLDTGVSAGQVALVRLGDAFRDAFFRSKAALTDITNAIADSLGGENFAGLLADVQAFGAAIAATLEEVAQNLPAALSQADLSGFRDGIAQVADALRRLFGDIDLSSVESLQAGIERAGTAVSKLGAFTAATIDQIGPFFSLLVEYAGGILDADASTFALAGTIGGLAIAANTALPLINSLVLAVLTLGGTGGAFAKAAAGAAAASGAIKGVAASFAAIGAAGTTVAAGVGLATYGLGRLGVEAIGLDKHISDLVAGWTDLDSRADETIGTMRVTAESLGLVAKQVEQVGLGFEEAGRPLGQFELENKSLIQTLETEQSAIDGLKRSFAEQGLIYDEATGQVTEFQGAIYEVATATDVYNDALEKGKIAIAQYTDESGELVTVYKDIGGGAAEAKQSLGDLLTGALDSAAAFNQFAEDTGVAKDKILEFATELKQTEIEVQGKLDIAEIEANADIAKAQIASIEKVALAKVELDIAEVQANAQVATALIQGIADSAVSTNENIRTVIDAIAGLDKADELAFSKQKTFEKQLRLENERIDSQLETQKRLAEAQISYYQESTRRLRTGDALITINGDGLEPELEAFMFAVLRRVQIAAQSDQAGFLLGLPA